MRDGPWTDGRRRHPRGQKLMALNDSDLRKEAIERATTTFAAIRAPRLYGREHNLFGMRRWGLFGRDYEDLWPFAGAWSALCTLGSLPGQKDALDLADAMVNGLRCYSKESQILDTTGDAGFESVVRPPFGSGGDRFYDDNAWLGLALVRHHEIDEEPGATAACPAGLLLLDLGLVDRYNLAVSWRDPLEGTHRQSLPQCLRKRADRGTGGATPREIRRHDVPRLVSSHLRVDTWGPTRD